MINSGPTSHSPSPPQIASTAVPSTTRLNKLIFSDFAAAWTIFGNITAASGITSHSNARDSVPAATYGAISSSLKYAFANIVSEVNMNWHAPKPNINGSTCVISLCPSNRSLRVPQIPRPPDGDGRR